MTRALLGRLRDVAYRLIGRLSSRLFPESAGPRDSLQRVVLNREVDAWIAQANPSGLSVAEVSGTTHQDRGWAAYESLMYPAFDLCAELDKDHTTFDVVFCEQVLEHVFDPSAAVRNLFRLCRPGGTAVVSTPFMVRLHELPEWGMYDYWRFTPRGMRVLLESAGFEVDGVSSWGNRETIAANLDRWTGYRRWHPTRNEPDIPVQVWAFARRPGS